MRRIDGDSPLPTAIANGGHRNRSPAVIRVDISAGAAAYIFMSVLDELGQAVQSRRHEMGLSQARVAVLSGLSRQMVSRIERGAAADLAIGQAQRLAQTLGITIRVVEREDW